MDESLGENICVTIIATGFKMNSIPELYIAKKPTSKVILQDGENSRKSNVNRSIGISGRPKQSSLHFPEGDSPEEYILFDESSEEKPDKEKEKMMAERLKNLKTTNEKLREAGYVGSSPEEQIEELESVPAYVRKKLQLDNSKPSESEEISRYRLSDDGEDNPPKLSQDNAYLHDNVD